MEESKIRDFCVLPHSMYFDSQKSHTYLGNISLITKVVGSTCGSILESFLAAILKLNIDQQLITLPGFNNFNLKSVLSTESSTVPTQITKINEINST